MCCGAPKISRSPRTSKITLSEEVSSTSGENCPAHSTKTGKLPGAWIAAYIKRVLLSPMIFDALRRNVDAFQQSPGKLSAPHHAIARELNLQLRTRMRVDALRDRD